MIGEKRKRKTLKSNEKEKVCYTGRRYGQRYDFFTPTVGRKSESPPIKLLPSLY